MAQAKKRLGRGLGGLITSGGNAAGSAVNATQAAKATSVGKASHDPATANQKAADPKVTTSNEAATDYREVAVASIVPSPYQPRREIHEEAIRELADSVQAEGLLQPIVVRQKDEHFELIAGERRWRAFQLLQIGTIPARVINAGDASSAALSLIENLQREGLNPIEEALGYASLIRDFDLTQEAAAQRVGKSRTGITNALRLLTLDRDIQGYLSRGLLSTGHAKVLLGLKEADQRNLMATRIIEQDLSVREAEKQVKRMNEGQSGSARKQARGQSSAAEESVIRDLEKRLSSQLNTRVSLQHKPKKGKLVIEYQGNDDLQRILDKIGVAG